MSNVLRFWTPPHLYSGLWSYSACFARISETVRNATRISHWFFPKLPVLSGSPWIMMEAVLEIHLPPFNSHWYHNLTIDKDIIGKNARERLQLLQRTRLTPLACLPRENLHRYLPRKSNTALQLPLSEGVYSQWRHNLLMDQFERM